MRYKNNITVTPGQSITCRTGNPNVYSDNVLNTSFGTTEDFAFYAEAGRYGGYGGTGETSGNGGGGSTITGEMGGGCLLYTSPSPRDRQKSRMPSSA